MSFTRFARFLRNLNNTLNVQILKQSPYNRVKSSRCLTQVVINGQSSSHSIFQNQSLPPVCAFVLGFNLFSFFKKDEETPEDKLITVIKRSILCIQRKEYDKAEQMLHMALRMAQDLRHKDGITYVYDVLANLAMERGEFDKAKKLFADVMQRLFSNGETENSLKVLHISSKMAHMEHLQDHYEKAVLGFQWTLDKIEDSIKKLPDNEDFKELKAITSDWYGQMLIDQQKYKEALYHFKQSYDIFVKIYGDKYTELVPILNNLSVAALGQDDISGAKAYLLQALEILKTLPESSVEGVIQANLGLVYLKQGLIEQARTTCAQAFKIGKKLKDKDSIDQANYCLKEVKKAMRDE